MGPKQTRSPKQSVPNNFADYISAQYVVDGRLARIRGQNILFSVSQRAIFSINDTAADIWCSLEEGAPPRAIADEIASCGVDKRVAEGHVVAALNEWERLALIRPCLPAAGASPQNRVSQVVSLPDLHVRIDYPTARSFSAAMPFRHIEVESRTADVQLQLVEQADRLHLFRNGYWMQSCTSEELPTMLKGQLLEEVLGHGAYGIALHAACVLQGDRLLLLSGAPGAGKTTLTMALVHSGFGFAGDDVTLLYSTGLSTGIPFAPAIKAGAWPILAKLYPGLREAKVFRRPDRKRVRYPVPANFVRPVPRPIGWVILLNRRAESKASLEPVDPAGALRGLLEGSYTRGGELGAAEFDALIRVIGSAEIYRLTYSNLEEAVELIGARCR